MWSDEGLSLYRATVTIPDILANTIEIDGVVTRDASPPFYFLLLHLFKSMAGESVFALRFVSAASATLSIPLLYALGATTLGRRVGLFAAIFMAISPFHVWQSQIMRNYGLLITLNLLSVYGLARLVLARPGHRRARWFGLWLAAGLLGIYTHYFAFFVFAFGLLAVGVMTLRRWRIRQLLRATWSWIILGLAIVILLPATLLALDRFTAGPQIDFPHVTLSRFVAQVFSALAVGISPNLTQIWWRVLPAAIVALLGLVISWRRRADPVALLVGYQFIPLAMLFGLSIINPIYNGVRHLLMALPPFIIFVAAGIAGPAPGLGRVQTRGAPATAWRVVGPALAIIVFIVQLSWLNNQFTAPELVRDDVRGAALFLNEQTEAGDVIVLHDTIIRPTFDYYYDGAAAVMSVPRLGDGDVDATIERLRQIGAGADRIWFLAEPTPRTGFDRHILSDWADKNWLKFFDKQYPSMWLRVRLAGYITEWGLATIPNQATPVDASWPGTVNLHAFEIPSVVTAGQLWWLRLYLSQPTAVPEQHTLSLRLVDKDGREWARMDEPIKMGFPPTAGIADTIFRYDHQVIVPPGVPPGTYALQARLINTANGATVSLSDGGVETYLADVTVREASCAAAEGAIPAAVRPDKTFGGTLQLLGYTLVADEIRTGFPIELDTWWCTTGQPGADFRLRLQLFGQAGDVVAESIGPLSRDDYPTSRWHEDELLRGTAQLTLPADLPGGVYDLRLSVLQPEADQPLRANWQLGPRSVQVGSIKVVPWSLETDLPTVQYPLEIDMGQPSIVELRGYDLSDDQLAPGGQIELALIWRSVAANIGTSYKTFVHLVDESGAIVAQSDSVPAGGFRPTTSWREGEVLTDVHTLALPADLGPGRYTLFVGLYDPETGIRVPIYVAGHEQADGRLGLMELTSQP